MFHAQGRWIGPTAAMQGLVKKAFGLFSKAAHNFNFCVKGVLAAAEAERSLEFTWTLHVESGKRAVQYQRQSWKVIYQKPRWTVHLSSLAMYDCKKVPGYWVQPIFQTNTSNGGLWKASSVLRTAWKHWNGSVKAQVGCMASIQKRNILGHGSKD